MDIEIERKFLVGRLPADLDRRDGTPIRQGYLIATETGIELRIRQKQETFYQTIKMGSGLARTEIEIELTRVQFQQLWPFTAGRRIDKTRITLPVGAHTAELDRFEGDLDGLALVEVEFDSVAASAAFDPPDWFGREVTEDERYKNKHLAVHGVPESKTKPA
jgi:CYTH domain-containing protein